MTKTSRWLKGAAAAAATLFVASCYYDPYGGGGYGGGGYYGGGGGLNATFVYTSSDRWLYDPSVYCYYDRYRRCYYDPYLYGYYPVGYCPRPIYGAYHPHGWRGHGHLPPPSGFWLRKGRPPSSAILNSVRRFLARPSSVELSATGFD